MSLCLEECQKEAGERRLKPTSGRVSPGQITAKANRSESVVRQGLGPDVGSSLGKLSRLKPRVIGSDRSPGLRN